MRLAAFFLLATPASAWEFTETTICTLRHTEGQTEVAVTFDPAAQIYTFSITTPNGWSPQPTFQLRFDGANPFIIGTDRHSYSDDSQSLSASDTGFGNVLNGIARNESMTAINGDEIVTVSTIGAAAPMEAFRNCPSVPTS